jgi:hypothetical protein
VPLTVDLHTSEEFITGVNDSGDENTGRTPKLSNNCDHISTESKSFLGMSSRTRRSSVAKNQR